MYIIVNLHKSQPNQKLKHTKTSQERSHIPKAIPNFHQLVDQDFAPPCIARRKATELVAAVKTFSGPASEFHFAKKEFHIQQARQHDMNMNTTGK